MSRIRTRAEIMARYTRETRRTGEDQGDLRRYIADAWEMLWSALATGTDTGLGQTLYTEQILADSPTWTPPADFRSLISLSVRTGATAPKTDLLQRTSWREVERESYDLLTGEPKFYLFEGPTSAGTPTPSNPPGQTIRFFPGLRAGHFVRAVYVTQEPSFGDPAITTDDTAAVDLMMPEVEQALIDIVRERSATRDDDKERLIAMAAIRDSLVAVVRANSGRDKFSPHRPDMYRTSNRWVGY